MANRADAAIIVSVGFSMLILGLALVAAASGIVAGSRSDRWQGAFGAALVAAAVTTIAGAIVVRIVAGLRLLAVAHVAYLAITVTVPLMALAALIFSMRARERAWFGARAVRVVLLIAILPALIGVYATHIEPNWLRVDYQTLTVAGTGDDAGTGGSLRVGVLADLQTPNIGDHERKAVARLIAAEPDIIMVAGDLWQMSDDQIAERWPEFRDLVLTLTEAVDHVVIVEGDTDDLGWLREVTAGTGAHLLANEVIEFDVAEQTVMVGGLTLFGRFGGSGRAVVDALAAAPADTVTILLSHRPDSIYAVGDSDSENSGHVDLVVAGHTHGGQVALPLWGPLITFSGVPRDVAAGGLHEVDGQPIYVSTGVGLERVKAPQIRFLVRPSVGVIDIVVAP